MGIGGSVIFSRKRGSEKCDGSENQNFTSAVIGAVILSILAWIGAICFERPILTFFEADGSYHCPHLCVILPAAAVQHLLDLLFPVCNASGRIVRNLCGARRGTQRAAHLSAAAALRAGNDLVCHADHRAGHRGGRDSSDAKEPESAGLIKKVLFFIFLSPLMVIL